MKSPKTILIIPLLCLSQLGIGAALGGRRLQAEQADIQKAKELYAKAMQARESDDYNQVLSYCREAVKLHPAYVEAHREIIEHAEDREALLQEYRERIADDPESPVFHYLLGLVVEEQSEKEAHYREALRLDPSFSWGYLGLGSVLLRKGLFDEGAASYQKATELSPLNYRGYQGLAQACRLQGKHESAKEVYQQMIEAVPEEPAGYLGLAWLLENDLKAPQEAAMIYRRAYDKFQHRDQGGRILYFLARLTSDPSEKAQLLEQAVNRDPKSPNYQDAYRMLLRHYLKIDPDRAAEKAHQALQLPSPAHDRRLHALAYETLLAVYRDKERQDLEKALADEILQSGPENPALHLKLGRHYADSGKDAALAFRFLEKALSQARAEKMLGTVTFGRASDEMLEDLARTMRDAIHLELGKLQLGQGRAESAVEELSTASASEEASVRAEGVHLLGLAYERAGRREEAIRSLTKALILHKKDEAREDLGRVYHAKHGSLEGLAFSLLSFATASASQGEGVDLAVGEEPPLDEAILRARTLVSGQAPDFEVETLGGEPIVLSALRSKVVVINFWATWCSPCLAEFPYFQKAYEMYRDRSDVQFLAISVEESRALYTVQQIIERKGYTFPVALSSETAEAYGVTGIPSLVVIGTAGRIQYRQQGFDENAKAEFANQLSKKIEYALGSKPSQDPD